MKRIIIDSDGGRVGAVRMDPFELTDAGALTNDETAAFEGVADVTDADTDAPPVNADQLAAEQFREASESGKRQALRNLARANGYALISPREMGRNAQLATRYTEGDVVQSPQGLGIISGVETEPFTGKGDEEIDASESSPTYIVALKDARVGSGFYSASELEETEMPDTGVDDPEAMLSGHLASASSETTDDADFVDTTFDIPESWDESPKPNRLILLDAWSSMGGTFTGARETLGSKRLAASMKDRVLGYEGWREGG